MSLLLALTDTPVIAPVVPVYAGGFSEPSVRRKKERWREELDRLLSPEKPPTAKARPVIAPTVQEPEPTEAVRAYVDGLFANILQAQRLQEQARQLALIAKADQEAAEAREMLALAIEAERIAQQEMQDFDIVFVATVLAHA